MADERTPLVPTNVEEERISANNHAVRISTNVEGRMSTNDEGRIMKLILSVVFSSVCILDGTLYSNGLLKNGLKADQGMNPTSLEYVGAIQVGLCCITSFFAAKVERWLGPRVAVGGGATLSALGWFLASELGSGFGSLALFQGVFTGVGYGLMFVPALSTAADVKPSALGWVVSGSAWGQVVICPLVKVLLAEVGWRKTYRVLTGICGLCALAAFKVLPKTKMTSTAARSEEAVRIPKVFENLLGCSFQTKQHLVAFILSALADCLAVLAIYMPYSFIPETLPDFDATLLLVLIGAGSGLGRMASGHLCNKGMAPKLLTPISTGVATATLFLYSAYLSASPLYTQAFIWLLFGFSTGSWIAAISPLLIELVGCPQVRSLSRIEHSPPLSLQQPITGIHYDDFIDVTLACEVVEND